MSGSALRCPLGSTSAWATLTYSTQGGTHGTQRQLAASASAVPADASATPRVMGGRVVPRPAPRTPAGANGAAGRATLESAAKGACHRLAVGRGARRGLRRRADAHAGARRAADPRIHWLMVEWLVAILGGLLALGVLGAVLESSDEGCGITAAVFLGGVGLVSIFATGGLGAIVGLGMLLLALPLGVGAALVQTGRETAKSKASGEAPTRCGWCGKLGIVPVGECSSCGAANCGNHTNPRSATAACPRCRKAASDRLEAAVQAPSGRSASSRRLGEQRPTPPASEPDNAASVPADVREELRRLAEAAEADAANRPAVSPPRSRRPASTPGRVSNVRRARSTKRETPPTGSDSTGPTRESESVAAGSPVAQPAENNSPQPRHVPQEYWVDDHRPRRGRTPEEDAADVDYLRVELKPFWAEAARRGLPSGEAAWDSAVRVTFDEKDDVPLVDLHGLKLDIARRVTERVLEVGTCQRL